MEQEKKYRITELTWEYHKNAERQQFVKILLSGNINEKLYATYLYNQLLCYGKLEEYCLESSLFHDTKNLPRAPHIFYDSDDPLYRDENGKTLFAVKPWHDPLRKISAKIDLYNRHRGFVECVWAEKHDFPGIPINIQFIPFLDYHDDGIHQVIRWDLYD